MDFGAVGAFDHVAIGYYPVGVDEKAAAARQLADLTDSRVIFLSSIDSLYAAPGGEGIYGACKAAIKAGEELSQGEMRSLFAALRDTTLPAHDVHGRSTIVHLTWDEVERRFGRR